MRRCAVRVKFRGVNHECRINIDNLKPPAPPYPLQDFKASYKCCIIIIIIIIIIISSLHVFVE